MTTTKTLALSLLALAATACGAAEPAAPTEPEARAEARVKQPTIAATPQEDTTSWSLRTATLDRLPACDAAGEGRLAFVVSEKTAYACSSGEWAALELRGKDGRDGVDGLAGARGERGEKGERGEAGPQGERGERGEQGLQGAQGVAGATGATGATGAAGQDGADAPAVVSTATVRFLFPTSALNAVTASLYGTTAFATSTVVVLEVVTRSDGSRCASGVAALPRIVAPYGAQEALVPEKCGTGELRLGFAWAHDHGVSFALPVATTSVRARAGWWGTGASYSAPAWGTESTISTNAWDPPTAGL